MKNLCFPLLPILLIFSGGIVIGWLTHPKCAEIVDIRVDTLIKIDTLRDTVRVPVERYIARVDTVWLQSARDTVRVEVEVPIERKVYQTDDYRAEIEGFRPSLVSMEVYRQTQYINTVQTVSVRETRRWGIGIQAGYGIGLQNGEIKAYPYVGVGVHYSLFGW